MLLRELRIENFRGFRNFSLEGLGRLNLLVGANNSGKTSILEAIHFLASQGDMSSLAHTLSRRGEVSEEYEWEILRLFNGHRFTEGEQFKIEGVGDQLSQHLAARIEKTETMFDVKAKTWGELGVSFNWESSEEVKHRMGLALDRYGRYQNRDMLNFVVRHPGEALPDRTPVVFIATNSQVPDVVVAMYENVVLTSEEQFVVDALREIEPRLERLATVSFPRAAHLEKTGIVAKLRDIGVRVPIGSLGDGVWRLLGLVLSLVECKGGVFLVDEIDTGLHFTVMDKMWRIVYETAKRLDVQVFATTHSRDCYESLASICREDARESTDISIHRIDREHSESVVYDESMIIAAAERAIEVR